jgi:hypothetical protein
MLAVEMEKQKDAAEMEMQDSRVRAIANLEAYLGRKFFLEVKRNFKMYLALMAFFIVIAALM